MSDMNFSSKNIHTITNSAAKNIANSNQFKNTYILKDCG